MKNSIKKIVMRARNINKDLNSVHIKRLEILQLRILQSIILHARLIFSFELYMQHHTLQNHDEREGIYITI